MKNNKPKTAARRDLHLEEVFGREYAEIVSGPSLEYIVKLGISSGLKGIGEKGDRPFNTEAFIAQGVKGNGPALGALLVVAVQCRELLAKQCRLLEDIKKLAQQ